jgi:hypothetical protein
MSAQDDLLQQILSQGTTSKWSGGYGTDSAARDMARILSGIGITDIRQFGEVPKYEDAVVKYQARGRDVNPIGDGRYIYHTTEINNDGSEYSVPHIVDPNEVKTSYGRMVAGGADDYGNMNYYFQEAGPLEKAVVKDGKPLLEVGKTYGNKLTGQTVPSTYGERQTGNAWGGTFEGSGNTGYRVQFTSDGTPVFYTTGASSNTLVNMFQDDPLLGTIAQIGAAYFGGPAGSAALAAAMGKSPQDIAKAYALSTLGNMAGNAVSGMEGITEVLGEAGTKVAANIAKQAVSSEGKKIDPIKAALSSGFLDTPSDGPNSSDFIEGYFQPGGEGYISSAGESVFDPTFGGTLPIGSEEIDWNSLYNTGLSKEEIAKREALIKSLPGQEMQITSGNLDSFNKNLTDIINNKGGYTSQWQTVGSDRVMVNDDGTGIGTNENGDSYALSQEEVNSMIKNGLLNTAASGYVAATGGTGNTPGGSGKAPATTSKTTTTTPGAVAQPTAQQSTGQDVAPALLGIPGLGNVFYYGKDFSSQKQELDPRGRLIQQEYDPLSLTQAGPELQLDKMDGTNENDVQALIQQIMTNSGGTASPEEIAQILGQGSTYG